MFKKNTIAALVALNVMFVPAANALIPTTDFANLAQNIFGSMQNMYRWAEEKALKEVDRKLQTNLFGKQTDAANNASARTVVSLNRAQQDIQNIETEQRFMPAPSACQTLEIGQELEETYAHEEATKDAARDSFLQKEATFNLKEQLQREARKVAAQWIVDACEPDSSGISPCLDASALFGESKLVNKASKKLTKTAMKKLNGYAAASPGPTQNYAKLQVDLIAGPLPTMKTDPTLPGGAVANAQRVNDYRKVAIKSLVQESLTAITTAFNKTESGESELGVLWKFADARWGGGSSEFLKKITNTHPDKSGNKDNITTPTQVLREIALMQAFQSYMNVLQYEQSLRVEALTATSLAISVEPIQ